MVRGARLLSIATTATALALVACGARTDPGGELGEPADADADVGPSDVGRETGDGAREATDAADDAGFDAEVLPDAPACSADVECDDRLDCTIDRCDPTVGRCVHAPIDARCDDGVFCDGDERCDLVAGCVAGRRDCADAVSCTHDACDEASRACTHLPDDALCPISHGCDVILGCQARALAQTAGDLFEIRLPSGAARRIGPTGLGLTDIALHPAGTLYGVGSGSLTTVDTTTGAATSIARMSVTLNALDAAPDGTLYGAGGNALFVVDRATGTAKRIATFPTGLSSSGDLAFLGPRLVATATGGGPVDVLIELDLATGAGKTIGSVGHRCVWGLAAYGSTLYGLTCEGKVLQIDASTGAGTLLTSVGESFYGASAR